MRTYVDDHGIGPWDIHAFNPGNVKELREHGDPVERDWCARAASVGAGSNCGGEGGEG